VAAVSFNEEGTINWKPNGSGATTFDNPLQYTLQKYSSKATNLISNLQVSYQVMPGLTLKNSLGYTNMQVNEINTVPMVSFKPEIRPDVQRISVFQNNNINSWIIEPQLVYKFNAGLGKFDFLLGSTLEQRNNNGLRFLGYGFNSDLVLEDIRSAPNVEITSSVNSTYKYNALFARINYNLLDKYVVNLTGRRDGSSRFGTNNQFHNFAALGLAWIFSEELFLKNTLPFVSFGKLKGSYGTTGSDQIGDYAFMNLYHPLTAEVPYQGIPSLEVGGLSNPDLQHSARCMCIV